MKYKKMGSYAHFAPFLKVIILLISEIWGESKRKGPSGNKILKIDML